MVGSPHIIQPPVLRDLTDPGEVQRLNDWLLDVWKRFNSGATETITIATTASIDVKGGLIVNKTAV